MTRCSLLSRQARCCIFVLCLSVLAGLLPLQLHAQQHIIFQHLTVKEGLSQGGVTCILQDRAGFIWLGTQDGLNRYDGYKFRIFRHDPADSASLPNSWIVALAEDTSGTLWVRTLNNDSLLSRFDPITETFAHVPRRSISPARWRVNTVKADIEEPSGIRWQGSIGGGLTREDPETGHTTKFLHDPANPGSLSDDKVYSVYRDHLGTIWVGTKGGLDQFDAAHNTFVHYTHDPADPGSVSDNWIWPILEDRQGVLWVGTFRGGLNRFDRVTGNFHHYRHEEGNPRSLAGNQLLALFQDRSGMIWVGTNDLGVDRFHPELQAFTNFAHDAGDPGSLIDNNILSMYVDQSGTPWIGTRGGVEQFHPETGTFTHYHHNPAQPRSIGDDQAQCFLEDRNGALWIGLVSGGLDRLDRATGTFTHFRNNPGNPTTLSDNRVYALFQDRKERLWVGTYGGGLNLYDPATGGFRRYVHDSKDSARLAAPGVFAIAEGLNGELWVGTFGGGLDRLDPETGNSTHFKHDDARSGSISDNIIACLHVDKSGTLWVGTTQGLNKFDALSGTFDHFREKDGLANDVVFGILEDENGILWMSTNKGISRFDPKNRSFRNFNYDDGLQGDEFNQNAFARDPKTGEMYFGGGNGFTVFHPSRVRPNPFVPPLVFSTFTRYNTDDKEGKPIEEKGISAKHEITLSYKDNVANFEFAALDFSNVAKNRYAYKLEGYGDNWIQLGTERRATLTNLDGGTYLLRVRGSNSDGLWNDEGASLRIVVTPPWWKTTWAYAGYVLIFGFLLYSARRFELNRREQKAKMREAELRTKAVEAEKRALQAENERKTKELEDARNLQLSMLPKDVPRIPGYEIAVFMKTATEVGGDYYDFTMDPDRGLHIAFGDATGHGMQAGTIVTLMKGLFLSDAPRGEITEFFNRSSRAIKEIRLGRLFMAFTLVRLKGDSVSLSSAGMPPAFLYRKNDGSIEEILLKGMPLGAMKNFPYLLHTTEMGPGDVLLLLTDGLPEQKNTADEMFDYARVQQLFGDTANAAPTEIVSRLVREGESWMQGTELADDITLLVMKKNGNV